MPGIISTVNTRAGTTSPGVEAGTFFVAGITERGPSDALGTVRSIADFAAQYGNRVAYGTLYDHLRVFFEEGGALAKVTRVVGAGATSGALTLQDVSLADSVTLTARGAGDWSASVDVTVADGTLPNTARITVAYGTVTEVYDNLASAAAAAQAINLRSVLVSAEAEAGGVPAPLATTQLSSGLDDRASIVTADYVAALTTYAGADTGPGAVAVPGQVASVIGPTLLPYAEGARKVALLAPAVTADIATAKSEAAGLLANGGAAYGGLFYPAITINQNGALLDISPEGYVAGVRARTVAANGPWRAPAGAVAKSRTIVALAEDLDADAANSLDAANVSCIRNIYGAPRLYGWRSLSTDTENYSLLTSADTINYVLRAADTVLEEFVFQNIDGRGQLFALVYGRMVGVLQPIADAGGLFALLDGDDEVDPGYAVVTDASVNTPALVQQNTIRADISIRPSPTASLIQFNLTKVAVSASV